MTTASPFDEYLAGLPEGPERDLYVHVLGILREELPGSTETVSYGMPTFKVNGKGVASIMVTKKHLSLYPHSGSTLGTLEPEIAGFSRTKSALHFTPEQPLPDDLVRLVVRTRRAELG